MAGCDLGGDEDETISGINVTPLVDIVLVLLIIFIVTASFILRSSIPLDLPHAATSEESASGLMVVAIKKDGSLYINGRTATIDDLPARVRSAREKITKQGERLNVFVSADVGASYGRFAQVVDRLRLEGVTDVSMDTRPAEVPSEPPPEPSAKTLDDGAAGGSR